MIDLVSLTVRAGNGGNGKISFRREKYVPKGGPDGGHGGDGGSVILVGSTHFNTLQHFTGKKEVAATAGGRGGRIKQHGADGVDTVVEVPLGTVVWLTAENTASAKRREKYDIEHIFTRGEVKFEKYHVQKPTDSPPQRAEDGTHPLSERMKLIEVVKVGQQVVLCQGGFGGRGNVAFKGATNQTPLEAEYGTFGEQKHITLELKLLADVGLVGLPNAGKSTLLSKVTHAHPKVANYPFTTLEPNLGVLTLPRGGDLVMADIPGLIEGASEGKGLGHDFLRHIENCQILVFVLFFEENVVSDGALANDQKAELVWQQYQHLLWELEVYSARMLQKPAIISLNKLDLYPPELVAAVEKRFKKERLEIHPFSGFTGAGLAKLTQRIGNLFKV